MINNPAGGGGQDVKLKDFTWLAVGGGLFVGAYLVLGAIRNRNAAGTTTPAIPGTTPASGQPQTVYVPVNGPTDIVASETTDSNNQGSSIVNLPTATTVDAPITTSGGTVTGPASTSGPVNVSNPPTVLPPIVILPPPHNPVDPLPPTAVHPWWYALLATGPDGAHSYYPSKGESVNQIAAMFGVSYSDLAYNPHNQGLEGGTFLHDTVITHGNNHVPAGTLVWITTSRIPATKPA